MFIQIVKDKPQKDATVLLEQYEPICDTLIDTLVDGQAVAGFVGLPYGPFGLH